MNYNFSLTYPSFIYITVFFFNTPSRIRKNSEINKDSNNQNFFHGKFFIPSALKPGDITIVKLSKNSKKNNIKIKRN